MGRQLGPRAVTIREVAAAAQVSIKTVSRVINAEPHVTDEVRRRVGQVIAELGYRPNASARSLSSTRSYLVSLLFDDPASGYASSVQLGAINRCRDRGYHLVTERIDPHSPCVRADVRDMALALKLDGVILTPPICDNLQIIEALEAAGAPYVRLSPDQHPERSAFVHMDDEAAAFQMTSYLIELGHRRIGFIKGDPEHGASRRRLEGYRRALQAAGLAYQSSLVSEGDFTFRSGLDGSERLLSAEPGTTAIFASNDEMALGVLATAGRRGLSAPGDLSVAGFDDSPSAKVAWPQLTTIRQPNYAMAATAVDLLVDGVSDPGEDGAYRSVLLDFELVERMSTAPAPAARAD